MIMTAAALVALLRAPAGFGEDWENSRRSTNIEDRRGMLGPKAHSVMLQAGQLAQAKQFPFICPALKNLSADAAKLGDALRSTSSLWDMDTAFDTKFQAESYGVVSTKAKSANACEGSRQLLADQLSRDIWLLDIQRGQLQAAHGKSVALASNIAESLKNNVANQGIVDQIKDNLSLGKCQNNYKQFSQALTEYQAKYQTLLGYYKNRMDKLVGQKSALKKMACSSLSAISDK